jgi:hypothetical protein
MLHRATPEFELTRNGTAEADPRQAWDRTEKADLRQALETSPRQRSDAADDELPPTRRLRHARVLPGGGGATVRGGLAFTTGAHEGWALADLLGWFDEHLAAPGWMKRPPAFHELGVPSIAVGSNAGRADVEAVTKAARTRAVAALARLVGPDADGRFTGAAIHAGRVRRAAAAGRPRWVPAPRETDLLSDIVLALFAADILLDPGFYRAHLCVCRRCGRASIEPREAAREGVCTPCSGGLAPFRDG